jgi:hypothetical protein
LVAGRVVGVCSDLAIDFDEALGEDGGNFTLVQGVLEAVPRTLTQTRGRGADLRKRIKGRDSRPL